MSSSDQQTYERLCHHARQTALLESTRHLLHWDEQTCMPTPAGPWRAEQLAQVAGLLHERQTDPQLGAWLESLSAGPLAQDRHQDAGATIWWLRRQYQKQCRLPASLVEELARASVLGQAAWVEARRTRHYATFKPHLEKIVRLKIEQAEALGYPQCRYDALLDEYEPEASTAEVTQTLDALRRQLVPLVQAIADCGRSAPVEILRRQYAVDSQQQFGRQLATAIGFDFRRGRLDVSAHPFCSGLAPHDCRLTTRYSENHFSESFFGVMHEAGHGIYEQGLSTDAFGMPLGSAVSLGIHESQSRLWENMVGRSPAFWEFAFPIARQHFAQTLADVSLPELHWAVNHVQPSLIRVEADEVTYNLHIIIRFELEQALINEQLTVADLPGVWNEKYRDYLGVAPQHDGEGVLQDIHWSGGALGYFPTYTLGNIYAAQWIAAFRRQHPGWDDDVRRGEFTPLRDWLSQHIFRHGQRFLPAELVQGITGGPISPTALTDYLRGKLAPLYGLSQ